MSSTRRAGANAAVKSAPTKPKSKSKLPAPRTVELDKTTFKKIVKSEHAPGYILVDTSKCTGKETYNRLKAHLTAIDEFCIFDGKEALDAVKDKKNFNSYTRRIRNQLKTAKVVALYDLDSFTKEDCKLARGQLCNALTKFLPSELCSASKTRAGKETNNDNHHKVVICLTRLSPKKIVEAFNITRPELLHSYKVSPKSKLAEQLRKDQIVKLNGAIREQIESVVYQRPQNAKTKDDLIADIFHIMENKSEIIRTAQKELPKTAIHKFSSMRKHGDPITFLKVHYSPWLGEQGLLTQKALQQIDKSLFTSLIGKTRRPDSDISMSQIFPAAPRARYRKRQAGRSPRV